MRIEAPTEVKVADEVWISAALLQREHPGRSDFEVDEIVHRAKREGLSKPFRKSVYVHVIQHCVANRAPNSGRYRMLFETASGKRRLFRAGDPYHPQREGSKTTPEPEDLPEKYAHLLYWYHDWSADSTATRIKNDPLLALYGSGKDLWADEHADEYVRRIREGWE